jgi:ligand-binding SRPBCC domain-containing protein
MPVIYLETFIKASPEVVFDLSRSVDLHKSSMIHHKEESIAGIKSGLMNKGDEVTWQAKHLFKMRILKVHITKMDCPYSFTDEMLKGDFKKMRHEHYFKPLNKGTLMIDQFYFEAPFGFFGTLINKIFLQNYMARLLTERNKEIKTVAESDQWKQFINNE